MDASEANEPLATIGWGEQYDPTMISALRMANLIYQSFAYAEDEHWCVHICAETIVHPLILMHLRRDWWTALSNGVGSCTPNNFSCWDDIVADGWDDGEVSQAPNVSARLTLLHKASSTTTPTTTTHISTSSSSPSASPS